MKTIAIWTMVTAFLLLGGCTSAESYVKAGYNFAGLDKIAVIDVQCNVISDAAKNQIADFIGMELLKKGYTVIERAQVEALLEEHKFQKTELTSQTGAARAGRILNVPTVVVVNIPNFDEEISMTAKMIDVEDASILWMGSGSGTTGRFLSTIFGAAVGAGAGAAVSGDDDKLLGGVIGGVLGGAAGRALTPQKAKKAQKIIKKMCKSLPYRLPAR